MTTDNTDKFEEELMAKAAALPTSVTPERDLWPGIEHAINAPAAPRAGWATSMWAQAAAVVLLVCGSSGVTWYVAKQDTAGGPEVMDVAELFEPVSGEFGSSYSLGGRYLEAHGSLQDSLTAKLASMPESTRVDVIKNLNAIRVAIKEINEALEQEPDNVLLQKLLMRTYHEEISLMRKVDGIANSTMRREDI